MLRNGLALSSAAAAAAIEGWLQVGQEAASPALRRQRPASAARPLLLRNRAAPAQRRGAAAGFDGEEDEMQILRARVTDLRVQLDAAAAVAAAGKDARGGSGAGGSPRGHSVRSEAQQHQPSSSSLAIADGAELVRLRERLFYLPLHCVRILLTI